MVLGKRHYHRFQVAKITTEPKPSPFFSATTTPQAQGNLRVLSCRIRATFLFPLGTLPIYVVSCALRPPCVKWRLLLVKFRARRNYNNQYPPYVLKKRPRSDFKPLLMIQNLLSPRLFYLSRALSLLKNWFARN